MRKYFGTDGIRGIAYKELTLDIAYKVGNALYSVIKSDTVVIGCDTRQSSNDLVNEIARGASDCGMTVLIAGVIPTPAISVYSSEHSISGVMVTASHNPYKDNGIKVFNKGLKLTLEEELLVEEHIDSSNVCKLPNGKISTISNIYSIHKKIDYNKCSLKIGIDTAHGATYLLGKEIFSTITDNVTVTADKPNGVNINNGVGSTHIDNITSLVVNNKLDIGFSFDGDGDRVLVVDNEGTFYDGDYIIYVIATYMKEKGLLNKNTVVLTKMSNLGIINLYREKGINVVLTDVGDKYVCEQLATNNYSIGGEQSGHIILNNIIQTGDGMLAALFLTNIINETGLTLKELTSEITLYPEVLINLKVNDKSVVNNPILLEKVKELKSILGDEGKVMVRASGTEKLVRVSVSAKDEETVIDYSNKLTDIINKYSN